MRQKLYLLVGLILTGTWSLRAAPQPDVPQLTAVEPKTGVTTPGARVTVYGTGLSADAVVYFGGLQVRGMKFISPSILEVVTPYLRPGSYQLQLKAGATIVRTEVTFAALPSQVDSNIDRAVALVEKGQAPAAIDVLTAIAKTSSDYQVRAFAYYQIGQIYFAQGDWWRWAGVPIFLDSDKSGAAVQTSWRYRLSDAESTYILPIESDPNTPLRLADFVVENDATQNPEPRYFRGLVNARYGNLGKAKIDSEFILSQYPGNPSYRALAAYIAVLAGDKTQLQSLSRETISDARAFSLLGEATYLSGDAIGARLWWAQAAKTYPLAASLAYWAGKKHLARGQQRVAAALLNECIAMAPNSKEAREAQELLSKSQGPAS